MPRNYAIYNTIASGIIARHKVIALRVFLDPGQRLSGMKCQQLVELLFHAQDFLGMDMNVRRLSLKPAQWLVNHDPGMGQGKAFSLFSPGQEEGGHGGCLADADR